MKRLLMWCWLLTKRLYKKPTFVVLLVLIPLLVLGYGLVAQEDSGMITIALAGEDGDPFTAGVMESLQESSRLIRFVQCKTGADAEEMVKTGKADAAWIFAEDMESKVYSFVASRSRRDAFVRVVERESTVPLILAREKLSGAVFACCSEALYLTYVRENVPELAELSDEELMAQYDSISIDSNLFEFSYLDASTPAENAQDANYLLTPIRGLLAVVVVLCGLATAMYYIQDERNGTFAWVAQRKRAFVEFGCQMISVVNVSAVVLVALALAGLTVGLGREVAVLLMYAVCVAVFSMTMRRLAGSLRGLGMLLPLLTVVMLIVCPVFFDLGVLRELQFIFPPTYYINAAYNDRFLLLMAVYTLIMCGVYFLAGKVLRRA